MIKIILVVLMVIMVAIPCFAQEVEPDGIFSLNGAKFLDVLSALYPAGSNSFD